MNSIRYKKRLKMNNKKSDFQRFLETNWIMVKPWLLYALLTAGIVTGIVKCSNSKSFKDFKQKIEIMQNDNFSRSQR